MNKTFRSKDAALGALLDASSTIGLLEDVLNKIDGDEIPFSACYMEATLRMANFALINVHAYFDDSANAAEVRS